MSAQTSIQIYTTDKPVNGESLFRDFIAETRAKHVFVSIPQDGRIERIAKGVKVGDLLPLYRNNDIIYIACGGCPLMQDILDECRSEISEEIRGEHFLSNLQAVFGFHKLERWDPFREKKLPALKAYFRISIWGYDIPTDRSVYETEVQKLDLVVKVKSLFAKHRMSPRVCFIYDY